MNPIRALVLFLSLQACVCFAEIIVEQPVITGQADYGSGQGQSFLLPPGETAAAIQLHIGSVGNGGGSIQVQLWEATGSPGSYFTRNGSHPIAAGTLSRSDVTATPGWFTIPLDTPYINSSQDPVYLVFEIELLTAGSGGWNNYSFSSSNSYSGGHSVYWSQWSGDKYVIRDGEDLTFRILNSLPDPAIEISTPTISFERIKIHSSVITRVGLRVADSEPGYFYTLLTSEDVSIPLEFWDELGEEEGNGNVLTWTLDYGSLPDRQFFIIKTTPIER